VSNALWGVTAYLCFFIFLTLLTARALTWDVIHFICDPRVADLWTLLVHESINSTIFLPVA